MDAGLLLLRVVVGGHSSATAPRSCSAGSAGHGRHRTGAFFELLGYRPGVLFAVVAG